MRGANEYFRDKSSRLWATLLVVCMPLWLLGCTSVDPGPFLKYESSVQEAHAGIDAAMSINYDWTRSGFIESFASDPNSNFSELVIQTGQGYDWSISEPPIYLKVKQTRAALADLSYSFSEYARLLSRLAGRSLVSVEAFDQLTKDLNNNASAAMTSLNVAVPKEGVAVFSTAAAQAARLYIEKKRQSYLKKAIEENQSSVQSYSDFCLSLIQTIRGTLKTYYVERMQPIKANWETSKGKDRLKKTEAMLSLNEQLVDELRVLQELEETYKALPQANRDLATAIENPQCDMHGVQRLYASARRLQRLYSELAKEDK